LPIGATVPFFFYLLLIYDSDGYILAVALPLAAYGVLALGEAVAGGSTWKQAGGAIAAVLLAACLVLLPGGFANAGDRGYRQYAQHDAELDARVGSINRAFDPDTTILVTSHEYWQWSFRHVMYYLPAYTTVQLLPDPFFADAGPERPYLTGRNHEISFSGPDGLDVRSLLASGEQVVYVIPHDVTRFVSPSCGPFMRPFPTRTEEDLGVIRLTDTDVRIERSQLHCRPHPTQN
jgi:hypothetical protein